MREREEKTDRKDDWETRVLCPDESCIGVIGPDGRCKECGKSYDGAGPQMPPAREDEPVSGEIDEPGPDPYAASESVESEESDPDWETRVLCPDESCIGVIGPDGRCKECGKPFSASREEMP